MRQSRLQRVPRERGKAAYCPLPTGQRASGLLLGFLGGNRFGAVARMAEDAVPAGGLGAIQGRVGPGDQRFRRIAFLGRGHAAADGDRQPTGHLSPQPLGERACPGQIRVRHDDHELLAPVSGDDVGLADALVEQPGKLLQHAIAVKVPFLIVHLLEVVDVEQGHRENSNGSGPSAPVGR